MAYRTGTSVVDTIKNNNIVILFEPEPEPGLKGIRILWALFKYRVSFWFGHYNLQGRTWVVHSYVFAIVTDWK